MKKLLRIKKFSIHKCPIGLVKIVECGKAADNNLTIANRGRLVSNLMTSLEFNKLLA
jgi:hypothetical protein